MTVLLGKIEMAGKEGSVVRLGAGGVHHDVFTPAVPRMAVRIGEAVGDIGLELLRARLIAIHGGIGVAERWP